DLRRVVEDLRVLLRRRDDDLLERHPLEPRPGDRLVQLVDVSLVVLPVVILQRLLRQMRLERVHRVGQFRQTDHRAFSFIAGSKTTRSSFHRTTSISYPVGSFTYQECECG